MATLKTTGKISIFVNILHAFNSSIWYTLLFLKSKHTYTLFYNIMGRTHKAEGVLNLNPDRSRQILEDLGIYTADTSAHRNSLSWDPLSL